MSENINQLSNVLVAIRTASSKAESYLFDSIYNQQSTEENGGEAEALEEETRLYVEHLIRKAYISLLVYLDMRNLPSLSKYLTAKWGNMENDLLATDVTPYNGDIYVLSTDLLLEIANSISTVLINSDPNNTCNDIAVVLSRLHLSANKLNFSINNEKDLDKLAESFLFPIYPDLDPNPSISPGHSYRNPDTSIPSLGTLIEYKYLPNRESFSSIIDQMQADVRNYAQKPWEHLVFVIGQNRPYVTSEQVDKVILKEPTTFKSIKNIVVTF